jgi:hypothetical protein
MYRLFQIPGQRLLLHRRANLLKYKVINTFPVSDFLGPKGHKSQKIPSRKAARKTTRHPQFPDETKKSLNNILKQRKKPHVYLDD